MGHYVALSDGRYCVGGVATRNDNEIRNAKDKKMKKKREVKCSEISEIEEK